MAQRCRSHAACPAALRVATVLWSLCLLPVALAAAPDAAEGWGPALPGGGQLVVEPGGLRFPHVEGDVYQASNDPRAVFLRVPARRDQYSAEVTVEDFEPAGQFVKAGLVAWGDADNYVRAMIGFVPAGFESLAEWEGRARPQGIFPFFPEGLDRPLRLRVEVLERTVRTYLSADGGRRWFGAAGHTLPGGERCRDRIGAVGLIGTGGAATRMPLFSD